MLEAELGDERVQRVDFGRAVGTARAAHDHQGRASIDQVIERPHREVGALQGLDAPDEEQGRARPRAEVPARSAVARREHPVVDARRDDLDRTGSAP